MAHEKNAETAAKADFVRQSINPGLLVQVHAGFGYMMPENLLPIMDCANCQWHTAEWQDGGHCYMFREKPAGDRCGQMVKITKQETQNEGITDTGST